MNFGGYELVTELSRSPLGLTGTARGPGGKGVEFFVHVQYLDPIAARGEERLVVEAFLEKARIQQQVAGEHWAKIHAVGEIDEGAFVVSDLYPRSAQSLINGRTRLSGSDLQRVALGMLDGLIELSQKVEGRAHGSMDADDVLIDDRLGPGNWRVALSGPSPEKWSKEGLEAARLRDARSVGGVLLGIVEHRQSRALPTRIDVSEAWKRVGGGQAGEWVAAVNGLLDADLDPNSDWLERARREFGAIKTQSSKSRKLPLIAGSLLLLAVAGGGVYFAMSGNRGGSEEIPAPDFDELTVDVWQEWIDTVGWLKLVTSDLEKEWPGEASAELSPVAREILAGVREVSPKRDDIRSNSGETGNAWRPEKLFPSGTRFRDLVGEDGRALEDRRIELMGRPDVLAKANLVLHRASQIREACSAPAVRSELETLVTTLRSWGADDAQVAGLERSIADLSPETVDSSEEIIAFIKAVDAASRAGEVVAGLNTLDDRISSVVALSGDDASGDPVLSQVREIIHRSMIEDLPQGADAEAVYEQVRYAGRRAGVELDSLETLLQNEYKNVVKSEFLKLLGEKDLSSVDGFQALGEWRAAVKDLRAVRLPTERDRIAWLRATADRAKALDGAREQVEKVRQLLSNDLLKESDRAEIRDAIVALNGEIEEVDDLIGVALEKPVTIAYVQELNRANEDIRGAFAKIGDRAQKLVNAHSNTPDKVIALLDAPDTSFQNEPVLSEAFTSMRVELRDLAVEAKALSESERNARASELRDQFEREQDRLKLIQSLTSRHLDFPPTTVIDDPTPLYVAFGQRREQVQEALVESGQVPTAADGEFLETLAQEIEAAMSAATDLVTQFDRWVLVDDLGDVSGLASPVFAQAPEMGGAFAQVVTPLQARFDALADLASASDAEMMGIASDPAASPELRRAAYERAGADDPRWPATAEDLRLVLDAQNALIASIQKTDDPAWSDAEVTRIAQDHWRAAMERASTQSTFVGVRKLAAEFGLGSQAENSLPVFVRRNAAIVDLQSSIAGISRTDDPESDDQAVRGVVTAWLDERGDLFDADNAWIVKLRDALTAQASSGGDFDPSKYGPGQKGWSGSADDEIEVLSYRSLSGMLIRFKRVDTGDDALAWFLATEETSLDLFLDSEPTALAEEDEDASSGPRGWFVESNGDVRPANFWLEHLPKSPDFATDPMFAPGLGAPGEDTELAIESTERKEDMPVQHISLELAKVYCEGIGCELPPVEVWRAAAQGWYADAGLGSITVNVSAASRLGLQVRDAVWKTQFDYISGLGDRVLGRQHLEWKGGIFPPWGGNDSDTWTGIDDGHLYFAPAVWPGASVGGTVTWSHLVGNVAEIVSIGGDSFVVIGGSAMSPSTVSPTETVSPEGRWDLPAADVGFRPAFSVPAGELNPTVSRRVEVLLRESPFEFSGG